MAHERGYTVTFRQITVTAAQDLIGIYVGGSTAICIHTISLGQQTQTVMGLANIRLRHLPATVTSGAGGLVATPRPNSPNAIAARSTARTNDTTQALTSGTAADIADVWNLLNGYLYMPPTDDRIILQPNEAFIVSLDSPISVTASGYISYGELF